MYFALDDLNWPAQLLLILYLKYMHFYSVHCKNLSSNTFKYVMIASFALHTLKKCIFLSFTLLAYFIDTIGYHTPDHTLLVVSSISFNE